MVRNPVDIKIDTLVDKWTDLRGGRDTRLIRILHQPDEEEMVNTFFTFLLTEECDNLDIPIIFEHVFDQPDSFSKTLIKEMYGQIVIWNHAQLEDGTYNDPIDWQPDYSLGFPGNPASQFIENLNSFAEFLELPSSSFLVAILKTSFYSPKGFNRWLNGALQLEISPKIRLVVSDSSDRRYFDEVVAGNPEKVEILRPELGMDQLMSQLAAMGDPNDPVVQYRKALNAMIQGIEKKEDKTVRKSSSICLRIASEQAQSEPYWYGQVLVIYSLLCNYEIGKKNWKKATEFATNGVEEMRAAQLLIKEPYIATKFISQAVMARGAIYCVDQEWAKAHEDFAEAGSLYEETSDFILGMEACRMNGYVLKKAMRSSDATVPLVKGFHLAKNVPAQILRSTTFPGIIELLLTTPFEKLLPIHELEVFMVEVYGPQWRHAIQNWKNPNLEASQDMTSHVDASLETLKQ